MQLNCISWPICLGTHLHPTRTKHKLLLHSPSVSLSEADLDMCVLKVKLTKTYLIPLPLIGVSGDVFSTFSLTGNHNEKIPIWRRGFFLSKAGGVKVWRRPGALR